MSLSLISKKNGFTLIEVLIALAVISIALTALLLTTTETVKGTQRLREKTLANLVASQGLTLIQLDLVKIESNQETTQKMIILGTPWFWHARTTSTHFKTIARVEVTASPNEKGPFSNPLIGFRRIS